jgi:hypothetical protein
MTRRRPRNACKKDCFPHGGRGFPRGPWEHAVGLLSYGGGRARKVSATVFRLWPFERIYMTVASVREFQPVAVFRLSPGGRRKAAPTGEWERLGGGAGVTARTGRVLRARTPSWGARGKGGLVPGGVPPESQSVALKGTAFFSGTRPPCFFPGSSPGGFRYCPKVSVTE